MKHTNNYSTARRNGVVAVLFAIILPVLLLLAAIAINIAHMQLTRTELKIATDASARAGGRAWSEFSDLDQARDFAQLAASLNDVSGNPLILSANEAAGEIVFGASARIGAARFDFTPITEAEFLNGASVSGIQINATHPTALLFQVGETSSFTPRASSIATQIERDIALILDRSGSMAFFQGQITDPDKGEDFLKEVMTELHEDPANGISEAEYQRSIEIPRRRDYSDRIINLLSGDLKTYAQSLSTDYRSGTAAARFSRWHSLELGYDAFFDVLEETDQIELVSVVSFSNAATLDVPLTSDLDAAHAVAEDIYPTGSTAIGKGMLEGFDALNGDAARLSAVKTIIVMSDGVNRTGISPPNAADKIIKEDPSTVIHAVTFGAEADLVEMAEVARIGSGKHFHAANTEQLIEVFRELAASHRTLITD